MRRQLYRCDHSPKCNTEYAAKDKKNSFTILKKSILVHCVQREANLPMTLQNEKNMQIHDLSKYELDIIGLEIYLVKKN